MLSSRFVESSCLKCHYEVTDLVRRGEQGGGAQAAARLQPGARERLFRLSRDRRDQERPRDRPRPAAGAAAGPGMAVADRAGQGEGRPAQPAGDVPQGRAQPAPHRREDQRGVGAALDPAAARLPARHQDAALLQPQQRQRQRPRRPAGRPEGLPRGRDPLHRPLPVRGEQGRPERRRHLPARPGRARSRSWRTVWSTRRWTTRTARPWPRRPTSWPTWPCCRRRAGRRRSTSWPPVSATHRTSSWSATRSRPTWSRRSRSWKPRP